MIMQMRKLLNVMALVLFLFFLVLIFEWVVINAVLGCVSMDATIWQKEGHCFTVSQLLGA